MVWDACILTDMSNQEDMCMFRQNVIDQIVDGCTEMKDIISIIALTCHIITDQASSLIEVVHQDPMEISIMEIEYHKVNPTEAFPIREITHVWKQVMETLVHSTEVVADKHKKYLCDEMKI